MDWGQWPVQILDAVKWSIIISTLCIWFMIIVKFLLQEPIQLFVWVKALWRSIRKRKDEQT